MTNPENECRKAINRLRRSVEKSGRELESLKQAICKVEKEDFPNQQYRDASNNLKKIEEFLDGESERLQEKIFSFSGLDLEHISRKSLS